MTVQFNVLINNLFARADAEAGTSKFRRNPITGASWVEGLDSRSAQMHAARAALIAKAQFALAGPNDAPPLPLSYEDRERLKSTGRPIDYLLALFARSWGASGYGPHPSFADFVSGVYASGLCAAALIYDPLLIQRYPPVPLPGLGNGCIWRRPKQRP